MHDRIIEYFKNEYDEYTHSSEDDVSEGVKDFSKEMDKAKYWAVKEKLLREQMEGMNEDYILKAIFKLRTENT